MRGEPTVPALKRLFRPRTLAYFAVWGGIGLAMLFALGNRTRVDISASADRNPQFVRLSDGAIRNAYMVRLSNMESRPREMTIGLDGLAGGAMWAEGATRDSAARSIRLTVPADQVLKRRIYVVAPGSGEPNETFHFTLHASGAKGDESDKDDESFIRPEAGQ